jgi:hypothetical protein
VREDEGTLLLHVAAANVRNIFRASPAIYIKPSTGLKKNISKK